MKHDADDAIARLMRNRVEPGPAVGRCLDAEVVAAWFDGALTAPQRREAELHASTCACCQALLATMAQAEPVASPRRSLSLVRWLAPAVVAAAAVLVWINVAGRRPDVRSVSTNIAPETPRAATSEARQGSAPQLPAVETMPSAPSARLLEKREAPSPANAPTEASKPAVAQKKQEAEAVAAPSPMTDRRAQLKDQAENALQRDELAAAAAAPPIVRSADGTLWRIAPDGSVSRSDDHGTTWRDQHPGASSRLLAGSSPSSNVVWFAGADGVVVVTVDGVSWQRRALPDRVDVTGITAVDGQTATVTTRDGRHFITHDGGVTWAPAGVQENPAAPF